MDLRQAAGSIAHGSRIRGGVVGLRLRCRHVGCLLFDRADRMGKRPMADTDDVIHITAALPTHAFLADMMLIAAVGTLTVVTNLFGDLFFFAGLVVQQADPAFSQVAAHQDTAVLVDPAIAG